MKATLANVHTEIGYTESTGQAYATPGAITDPWVAAEERARDAFLRDLPYPDDGYDVEVKNVAGRLWAFVVEVIDEPVGAYVADHVGLRVRATEA